MKNLHEILNPNLKEDEVDNILGAAIEAKFDKELRTKWENKLREKHGVSKGGKVISLKTRRTRLYYIAGIAASICLLILALNIFSPANPQSLASAYVEETEFFDPRSKKGEMDDEQNRVLAIEAFNAGDYAKSSHHFSLLENKTEDDLYYNATASMLSNQLEEAITNFKVISANKDSKLKQESNWYLAVSYILNDQETEAKEILTQFTTSDWNFDKAQELLKTMEK